MTCGKLPRKEDPVTPREYIRVVNRPAETVPANAPAPNGHSVPEYDEAPPPYEDGEDGLPF